jgi:hypothetical protein
MSDVSVEHKESLSREHAASWFTWSPGEAEREGGGSDEP